MSNAIPLQPAQEDMLLLTEEEYFIVSKWRELGKWGTLEIRKQNGVLFEATLSTVDRPHTSSKI